MSAFRRPQTDHMCLVHLAPDAACDWRITRFDARGFVGHSCANSYEDAIRLAGEYGYSELVAPEEADAIMSADAFEVVEL